MWVQSLFQIIKKLLVAINLLGRSLQFEVFVNCLSMSLMNLTFLRSRVKLFMYCFFQNYKERLGEKRQKSNDGLVKGVFQNYHHVHMDCSLLDDVRRCGHSHCRAHVSQCSCPYKYTTLADYYFQHTSLSFSHVPKPVITHLIVFPVLDRVCLRRLIQQVHFVVLFVMNMLSRKASHDSHGQDSSYFLGWQEYEKNPYHPIQNPTGIIQMGLAENQVSLFLS